MLDGFDLSLNSIVDGWDGFSHELDGYESGYAGFEAPEPEGDFEGESSDPNSSSNWDPSFSSSCSCISPKAVSSSFNASTYFFFSISTSALYV